MMNTTEDHTPPFSRFAVSVVVAKLELFIKAEIGIYDRCPSNFTRRVEEIPHAKKRCSKDREGGDRRKRCDVAVEEEGERESFSHHVEEVLDPLLPPRMKNARQKCSRREYRYFFFHLVQDQICQSCWDLRSITFRNFDQNIKCIGIY